MCKGEYLTCKRGCTSACTYTCTYQILGELPAYIYGWLQILNKAIVGTLIARGLGSVFIQTIGNRLIRHHLIPAFIVNEHFSGIAVQALVSSFVVCGLQVL